MQPVGDFETVLFFLKREFTVIAGKQLYLKAVLHCTMFYYVTYFFLACIAKKYLNKLSEKMYKNCLAIAWLVALVATENKVPSALDRTGNKLHISGKLKRDYNISQTGEL